MSFFKEVDIFCRTCLDGDTGEYINLYSPLLVPEGESKRVSYVPTLMDCLHFCLHSEEELQLSTEENGDLPMYICGVCINHLKKCYKFIKTAKEAEEKIRQLIEQTPILKEETKIIEIEYAQQDDGTLVKPAKESSEEKLINFSICHKKEIITKEGHQKMDKPIVSPVQNIRLLPHQCDLCPYESNSTFNLRRHYLGKHKRQPTAAQLKQKQISALPLHNEENYSLLNEKASGAVHRCNACEKVFKSKYLLECHLNKHRGLNPYKCRTCNFECRYQNNLKRHYKIKHEVLPTVHMLKSVQSIDDTSLCSANDKKMDKLNSASFVKEQVSGSGEHCSEEGKPFDPYLYMCSKCSKKFKLLHILKSHELTCKTGVGENGTKSDLIKKPFHCGQCSSRFEYLKYLHTHCAVVHRKRSHQCHICEKSFKLPSQLNNHIARHTARNYQCGQCTRSYINQAELNVHMRVHTGEMPYVCEICLQRFRNADRLSVHRDKMHLHSTFKCSECTAVFECKAKLRLHHYKHTGMPYKCEICQKEFNKRGYLRRHMAGVHHTEITNEQLAEIFTKNMQRKNRYDVFRLID